jgi:hypothetical protein
LSLSLPPGKSGECIELVISILGPAGQERRERETMGRPPCCDQAGVKKGPWTPEEDLMLVSYIQDHGPGNWRAVPTNTGASRLAFSPPQLRDCSFSDSWDPCLQG